ncbi:MAG: hypothetical protein J6W50_02020, partial [Bacteroidaceae bacterium]|nr:hypothetical protein [Bacteroidaceae bacterium]
MRTRARGEVPAAATARGRSACQLVAAAAETGFLQWRGTGGCSRWHAGAAKHISRGCVWVCV